MTFECELTVDGATVEWYKGDRPIRSGDKYDVVQRGTVHRLTVNDVDAKDAGQYSAVFRNKSTRANLTVEGQSLLTHRRSCFSGRCRTYM